MILALAECGGIMKRKNVKSAPKRKAAQPKPGLYANIHKAQKRAKAGGRPVKKKGDSKAPTDKDFAKAKRTAKK